MPPLAFQPGLCVLLRCSLQFSCYTSIAPFYLFQRSHQVTIVLVTILSNPHHHHIHTSKLAIMQVIRTFEFHLTSYNTLHQVEYV